MSPRKDKNSRDQIVIPRGRILSPRCEEATIATYVRNYVPSPEGKELAELWIDQCSDVTTQRKKSNL